MSSAARLTLISAIVILTGALFACDKATEPRIEELASFRMSAPALITAGEPFSVTITAVGSNGTAPFTEFSGDVILSVSGGIVSPDTVSVVNGTGSFEVVFSGSSGLQTLTARGLGKTGMTMFSIELMTSLPGDPGDPIEGAIPDLLFLPDPNAYSTDHPELSGMYVSFNTIMMTFELGTTVQEGNDVLANLNAGIAGGIKGVVGNARGILFLRLPTANHLELEDTLASLVARSSVRVAVQDMLAGVAAIPQPNGGSPPDWTWESTPGGGNWGLERIRVPQMWNLNEAVRKRGQTAAVGVVDVGFFDGHPDLQYNNLSPDVIRAHGTHIAGIIGATFDNGLGTDGINPFARMTVLAPGFIGHPGPVFDQFASLGQIEISGLVDLLTDHPEVRVINVSLAYNWFSATPPIEPDLTPKARLMSYQQGEILADALRGLGLRQPLPIICAAAGNESSVAMNNDAVYSSPMTNAGIAQGIQEILVVENVADSPGTGSGNATRAANSCINGQISAPGTEILSTSLGPALYEELSGTSQASPHVAGVASYMLCVDPTLTPAEVRDILTANSLAVGGGAKNRIDAWASVIDIDLLRSNDNVIRMMCDIDDGTPDGSQRVDYEDGSDYTETDADNDGGIGDGQVDMSDFRVWRDWFLALEDSSALELDGSGIHPKKDVNGDGRIEVSEREKVYPQGDFNGDGKLHETEKSLVPGRINAELTDLEVLKRVFSDPSYTGAELDDLIHSADLEVDAALFQRNNGTDNITAEILSVASEQVVATHLHTSANPRFVFTLPYEEGGYWVSITAGGRTFGFDGEVFMKKLGGDDLLRPVTLLKMYPKATFYHVCKDDQAFNVSPIQLSSIGVKPGDRILVEVIGQIDMGDGFVGKAAGAVFSASNSLLGQDLLNRVPGAIAAGDPFFSQPTYLCGGEPTDIPEDFNVVDHAIVTVPDGAQYLFIAKLDPQYMDNSDLDGDYAVQITILKPSQNE